MAAPPLKQPRLQTFDLHGRRIVARRWGPGGTPTLALHGWMDNAASFDLLAPQLPNYDWVCLDCAGHGLSDARGSFGAYNLWQDAVDLFAVADILQWERFNLVGHSRGAMQAFIAAGTFPERIQHLILIEGVVPREAMAEDAPRVLAEAMTTLKSAARRPPHFYPTFEQAVQARARGMVPVHPDDARLLANHGVIHQEKGFRWQYDYQLTAGSEVRFSRQQVNAFRDQIAAKTLLILADAGVVVEHPELEEWLQEFAGLTVERLAGRHHLHMTEASGQVAEAIGRFVDSHVG